MEFTAKDRRFFDTFGFLVVPGLVKDDVEWISTEFERVFEDRHIMHDGSQRTMVLHFIGANPKLSRLLDHPQIGALAECLLGPNYNYIGSDGNYYTGHTDWHPDGNHSVGKFVKLALYLDPVGADSGALRVIPGSHRRSSLDWEARDAVQSSELWGIGGERVPATVLESQPGDVVAFNHNLMHSSWGGSSRRRMFTINLCRHCASPQEMNELKAYVGRRVDRWRDPDDLAIMLSYPTGERRLKQTLEARDLLPASEAS